MMALIYFFVREVFLMYKTGTDQSFLHAMHTTATNNLGQKVQTSDHAVNTYPINGCTTSSAQAKH